jgi:hypothetical protein
VTKTITRASAFGIFVINVMELQANVPITTMNITPTKAAIGIASIRALPYKIKKSRKREAAVAAILVLPPDLTFIIDCPIIAHPPIPPKNPVIVFAAP